jgi:hypothetical protein
MPLVPHRRLLLTVAALGALGLAGCTNPHSGELLLADAPDPQGQATDIAIYAVDPGDPADADSRLTPRALSPLEITTAVEDGQVWVNSLGRTWDGSVLMSYSDGESSIVSAGTPGEEQQQLARSASTRTNVLRRGTYVQTAEGCQLATSVDDVDQVGTGNCAISLDERWVVSWPLDGQGLTVRDLRDDSTEQVDDLQVGNAGALSADGRVIAITRVADGYQAVVIDGGSGEEIGRTETYDFLDLSSIGADAEGFVLQAASAEGSRLLYVDTDGKVSEIDSGFYLVPIINGAEVTYLRYSEELADSSVRRWTPGDDEPEVLLTGYVGAASPDGEHVLVSRETAEGTELWREEHGSGEMHEALTLPRQGDDADPTAGAATGIGVSQMWTRGHMVYLQVNGASTSSFVRVDMVGDHSDVPVQGEARLLFESLDVDGTALLTRGVADDAAPSEEILVVGPHDDEAEVRTSVGGTAANLIHEGVIYLTDTSDPSRVTVSSLRSRGSDDEPEELYANKQIAGATWPQWGGATKGLFVTPRLLLEQAQNAQQQQQQAAGQQAGAAQP